MTKDCLTGDCFTSEQRDELVQWWKSKGIKVFAPMVTGGWCQVEFNVGGSIANLKMDDIDFGIYPRIRVPAIMVRV